MSIENNNLPCICEGNWRHLINEYQHLYKRKFERNGKIYTFIGILDAEDDYYYTLIDSEGKLQLSTCVVHLEHFGYKLINE